MSQAFDIKISGDLVAAIPRIKDQVGFARALGREMDIQNGLTVSHIQRFYLDYPRTGPSVPNGLRNMTGSYFRSLISSKAVILGNGVRASIGTNVKSKGVSYPTVHEFGAEIERHVMAGVMRVKTNKAGKLARQGKNGQLLVIAGRKDKHFTHIVAKGAKWKITIPARAPIGHGIADRQPEYIAAFERVTEKYLKGQI